MITDAPRVKRRMQGSISDDEVIKRKANNYPAIFVGMHRNNNLLLKINSLVYLAFREENISLWDTLEEYRKIFQKMITGKLSISTCLISLEIISMSFELSPPHPRHIHLS